MFINGNRFIIFCAASLGAASRITVTIAASDDAHGVFDFSPQTISVNGTEPEDGRNSVILQVIEIHNLWIMTCPQTTVVKQSFIVSLFHR